MPTPRTRYATALVTAAGVMTVASCAPSDDTPGDAVDALRWWRGNTHTEA